MDAQGGVGEEGKRVQPDVVAFLADGGEFEGALRGEDEDGAVEWYAGGGGDRGGGCSGFGEGVVVADVEDGLDGHCGFWLARWVRDSRWRGSVAGRKGFTNVFDRLCPVARGPM